MSKNIFGLILTSIVFSGLGQEILVTIPNGMFRGRKEYSLRNITFYAFQSVPYGKAPVGKLRFKDPVPVDKWDGILDVTDINGPVCYQTGSSTDEIESEDCLVLNVYTPVYQDVQENLPVMVFIHGGCFHYGGSNFNSSGPHYLMENGVVVVTVHYRLGPFGFLSTGDTIIPGNYGLKDQNLALKWIQENIQYFGGDPNQVTLFGQSAGAASVSYHLMSKMSEGLFRAAILESGTNLDPWSYQRSSKDIAYQVANNLGANFDADTSSEELLQFLQKVSAADLRNASDFGGPYMLQALIQGFTFTPVIEPEHDGAFITEKMYEAVAEGHLQKVPIIIGITSEEMLGLAESTQVLTALGYSLDTNDSFIVSSDMHITDISQLKEAAEAIRNIYTQDKFLNNSAYIIRFFTDTTGSRPSIHFAELLSKYNDVYFYQFSYHGELGGNALFVNGAERVVHGEELPYIWVKGNSSNLDSYPTSDILTSNRIRKLFTNFAKTLTPTLIPEETITWPKMTPDVLYYLNINDTLSIEINPKQSIYSEWIHIYETYGVKPYDTF